MRVRILVCSVFLGVGALAFACGGKKPPKEPTITETVADAGPEDAAPPEPPAPKSLFERLGGKDGIAKVVDDFVQGLTTNDVTKKRFAKLSAERIDKFKKNLVDQLCHESGGDCEYGGKSMKDAHKGMKINDAEWNATVQVLKKALDANKIDENEQNDLIAAIAPMRDDIVETKPKPGGKK